MFQFPGVSEVRKTIKKAPINRLQVCALEDRWLLMHFLEVPEGLEVPCFNFQESLTSGRPSRRPLSSISRLNPWRIGGSGDSFWK